EESLDRRGECAEQRLPRQGSHEGALEGLQHVLGEVVIPSAEASREVAATTGEGEGIVADGADAVLGLPPAAPLDAGPPVASVRDGPAEEVLRRWRRRMGPLVRLPEEQPEPRAARSKS